MKLTLSSFLYNTAKSKLKPRDDNGLRNGKTKNKTKESQQGKEKTASQHHRRSRLEYHINKYQHQKPEPDQREMETEITHCIGYKISGDHEKGGFRGRGEN